MSKFRELLTKDAGWKLLSVFIAVCLWFVVINMENPVEYRVFTANIDIVNISAAEEAGMTESDYFRLLITQQPSDYPEIRGGIKVLINEVNRIGVNINEIVFNNNSNLYRTADKERLIAYMRRLNETLAKVVDDCGYH